MPLPVNVRRYLIITHSASGASTSSISSSRSIEPPFFFGHGKRPHLRFKKIEFLIRYSSEELPPLGEKAVMTVLGCRVKLKGGGRAIPLR